MALLDLYREVSTSPFSSPQARAFASEYLGRKGMGDGSGADSASAVSSSTQTSNQSQVSNVTFAAPSSAKSLSDSPWAQVALVAAGLAAAGAIAWIGFRN